MILCYTKGTCCLFSVLLFSSHHTGATHTGFMIKHRLKAVRVTFIFRHLLNTEHIFIIKFLVWTQLKHSNHLRFIHYSHWLSMTNKQTNLRADCALKTLTHKPQLLRLYRWLFKACLHFVDPLIKSSFLPVTYSWITSIEKPIFKYSIYI